MKKKVEIKERIQELKKGYKHFLKNPEAEIMTSRGVKDKDWYQIQTMAGQIKALEWVLKGRKSR